MCCWRFPLTGSEVLREVIMTSRREFLQIGMAAGALPLASRAAFAQPPAGRPRAGAAVEAGAVPLYKVVYDARFADSLAFAARARALDLPMHEIEGDITPFWYHELDAVWRAGASSLEQVTAIAGLTAHGPLFCLERLGWDQRLRVVFRAEHERAEAGGMDHRLSGPVSMLEAGHAAVESGGGWAGRLADVVAACPRGRTQVSSLRAAGAAHAPPAETLYSWVIARAVPA
jgi:hypothetical protein